MSAEIAVSIVGVCGVVIAAILKLPKRNGSVSEKVCQVRHEGIDNEIEGIRDWLGKIEKKVDQMPEKTVMLLKEIIKK